MNLKSIFLILPLAVCTLVLIGCGGDSNPVPTATPHSNMKIEATIKPTSTPIPAGEPPMNIDQNTRYVATINTNQGSIEIELFPREAPKTVGNFVTLSRNGFYNDVIFHRVIPNFMVQGGDPTGTGRGGPGYTFADEFHPTLKFDAPGILAMANAGPNTNGSQFFITTAPTPHLTGAHTIFGRVLEGQDVVEAISKVSTSAGDRPVEDVKIQSIRIDETPAE